MSYFLTDPENPLNHKKPTIKRRGQFVKYCDRVVQELVHLGMPLRCAEVVLIDLRQMAFVAYTDKEVPLTAAERMINKAEAHYKSKKEDGTTEWHYS